MELVFVGLGCGGTWFLPEIAIKLLRQRGILIQITYWFSLKLFLLILSVLALLSSLYLFPSWYDRWISFFFWLLLIMLSLTDLWSLLLLDLCTIGGMVLMLVLRLVHPSPILPYLLAALLVGISLTLISLWTKGIGLGDAKLLALCALVLGLFKTLLAFWLATGFGLLYAVGYAWYRKKWNFKQRLPFGPFIALGSYIVWLWGETFQDWLGIDSFSIG